MATNIEIAKYFTEKTGVNCSHTNVSHAKHFHPDLSGYKLGDALIEDYRKIGKFPRKRENEDRSHKRNGESVIKNVELTHKGGCGELHFHNCTVTIHISK